METKPDSQIICMTILRQINKSNFLFILLNILFVVCYIILPLTIRSSLWLQIELAYMTRINIPPFADLDNPIHFGLPFSYNLKITHDLCEEIGAWHILPHTSALEEVSKTPPRFGRFGPIVIYNHGTFASRAMYHRVSHYQFLSEEGFEVLTYDYRGFADSPGSISEVGLINDAISVYKYVLKHLEPGAQVYIWGHSLGSGISIQALFRILKEQPDIRMPEGLVLECPFINFIQAAYHYPLFSIYRLIPKYAEWLANGSKIKFDSDMKVPHLAVALPILILHGDNDFVVPLWQGEALYQAANLSAQLQLGEPKCLKFGRLPETGHNGGFSSFMMKKHLNNFTSKCIENCL